MPDHLDGEKTNLITRIYDAVMAPEMWPQVLFDTSQFLGGKGSIIFDLTDGFKTQFHHATFFSSNYDQRILKLYFKKFGKWEANDQQFFEHVSLNNDDIELVSDITVTDQFRELATQPSTKFLQSIGLSNRAGALLNKDQINRDRFSIQFDADHGPMTPEEGSRAKEVLPHVAKSLAMSRHFGAVVNKAKIAIEALDQLQVGIAITDNRGRTIHKNTELTRILDDNPLIDQTPQGRLALTQGSSQRDFNNLLGGIERHGHFGARPRKEAVICDQGALLGGLCVEVSPLRGNAEIGSGAINGHVIACVDTSRALAVDLAMMVGLYKLSKAEETVLKHLIDGLPNKRIADEISRSPETVNSHVKAMFAKTGCENRTQLVRLAIGLGQRIISDSAA